MMEQSASYARAIVDPPRSTAAGAAIALSVTAIYSVAVIYARGLQEWALPASAALLAAAMLCGTAYGTHLALLIVCWLFFASGAIPVLQAWPFFILMALASYTGVVLACKPLRTSVGWLRIGRFSWRITLGILGIVVVSSTALILWVMLLHPDLKYHKSLVPDMPLWAYPLAAIAFAALNAAIEEGVFRGIMMEALDSALGAAYGSIAVQAVAFGAFHYVNGFPNGEWGFAMVFVYGLMLGVLRRHARGLLAPWLAHFFADLTIFCILAALLLDWPAKCGLKLAL